jgi:pyruvate dehydrogenase kinase 2/3/4
VVAEGGEDVTIKVSDEGGGIPRSGLPRIWTYLYSTAKAPVMETVDDSQAEAGEVRGARACPGARRSLLCRC